MRTAYEVFKISAYVVITFVGVITAIYTLITYNKKIKTWRKIRRERQEKLDNLLENTALHNCGNCSIEELRDQVNTISESVETLANLVKETVRRNEQQDIEIMRSRRQREVHDIALFALVDERKQSGANGAITNAHEALTNYLRDEAHKPVAI